MTFEEFETLMIDKIETVEGKIPNYLTLIIQTKDFSKYSFIISKELLKEFSRETNR